MSREPEGGRRAHAITPRRASASRRNRSHTMSTGTAVVARDVSITVAGRAIITGVSAELAPGRSLALVGPSGAGKTTLLNALGLLQPVSGGSITIGDAPAHRWRDGQRRRFWRDRMAFIAQDYGLVEDETVAYNVALHALSVWRGASPHRAGVPAALAAVGLEGREKDRVSTLSGGERQRVGIARAVFKRGDVILADEPTASLDEDNREAIAGLLFERVREGAALAIATHDLDLAGRCDSVLELS